jgi:hypothetical protein
MRSIVQRPRQIVITMVEKVSNQKNIAYIDAVDKKEKQFIFFVFISHLAVIKTFIDRIIKRLQHFKRSLDGGLSMRLLFYLVFLLFPCICLHVILCHDRSQSNIHII